MENITILPATYDGDINTITELAEDIWTEHFTPIIGIDQVSYMLNKFQSYDAIVHQIVNEKYLYSLIKSDDIPVGYIGYKLNGDNLFLSKLYLLKDVRGNGISHTVLDYLISVCHNHNLSYIWLTCNRNNTDTLNAYYHLGFEKTNEVASDIGNGFVMDDFILTYRL